MNFKGNVRIIKSKPLMALIILEVLLLLCVLLVPRFEKRTEYSFAAADMNGNSTPEVFVKKGSYNVTVHYTSAESNGVYHFDNHI